MDKNLVSFFNMIVEEYQNRGWFQPQSFFRSMNEDKEHEDLILDFFHYLVTHNIVRVGAHFNSSEMPFMALTKYGRTLIKNEARRISIFESFLEQYNAQ